MIVIDGLYCIEFHGNKIPEDSLYQELICLENGNFSQFITMDFFRNHSNHGLLFYTH